MAITMLALGGPALWILGVGAMTRLAAFVPDQAQRHDTGLPVLGMHSLLSGLAYRGYARSTGYAVPMAVAAIVLLLVLTDNRLARSLAGVLLFGIGTAALVLYLWSFFALWELVPRLRRLWVPDPPPGSGVPRGALARWLVRQGFIDCRRR